LFPPKSIFFNDRLGLLFVRATMQDLDTIESAIQALNQVAPQVHIKSRFIQVEQDDNAGLGFDWYLGQFNIGHSVAAQGGSAPSLNVPGPGGSTVPFPGPTGANQLPSSGSDQQIFGPNGAVPNAPANANLPTLATITGILTNPNFRVVLHALEQRSGFEELAEPEVTTTSGRQTEMRATQVITVITGFSFQQGSAATTTTGTTP
jgi:general secretion pathway protein D